MKYFIRVLALLGLASITFAYVETIRWTPPAFYTNGNVLLEQELDFYTFYCDGQQVEILDSIIGTWQRDVEFPDTAGQHECWLTATTLLGVESGPSNTKVFTNDPRIPMAPVVEW